MWDSQYLTVADVSSGMSYRDGEYLATTTSLDAAQKFAELPMNNVDDLVILKMTVDIVDVIFEGHEGEGELVIRNPQKMREVTRKEAK